MDKKEKRYEYFMYVVMDEVDALFKIFAYRNKITTVAYPGIDLDFKFISGDQDLYFHIISNMKERYFNIEGPTCRKLANEGVSTTFFAPSKYYESICRADLVSSTEEAYNELKSEISSLKLKHILAS